MTKLLAALQTAALPQKLVLILLVAVVVGSLVAGALELRRSRPGRRDLLLKVAVAAPALGLLVGAMNAVHMVDTALRRPAPPSLHDLAPGVMEIATLVGLGALADLVAIASTISRCRPRDQMANL